MRKSWGSDWRKKKVKEGAYEEVLRKRLKGWSEIIGEEDKVERKEYL